MAVTVRRATIADAGEITGLHIRSWQEGYRHVIPADFLAGLDREVTERTLRRQTRLLAAESEALFDLVAERDGEIAGWLAGGGSRDEGDDTASVGEVYACYVDPSHWRHGVGTALMAAALDRLAADGYREAILWVLDDNQRARSFYERHGWANDGGKKPFEVAGTEIPEVRYRRPLPATA